MSAPVPVIVNRSGGTAASLGDKLADTLPAAFADAGLEIALDLVDGGDVGDAAARHAQSGAAIVVVGGGDGTLGGAVGRLAGTGTALGILPLGTRNHLAHDLGIPDDLAAAARVIAAGHRHAIDLGTVNGETFVNNASIGLYPLLVRGREAEQRRTGAPKWLASLPAARAALRRLPHHRLRLAMPAAEREIVTPLLFVGNNRYALDAGEVGKRTALDDGMLSVYAVASRTRLALIGFALRTLVGRARPDSDFAAIGDTPEMTVSGHPDRIDVALDGEVRRIAMPLDFAIRRRALDVLVPPPAA